MEVILKEDVRGLGRALEIVKVKNGFAHNFLFPRQMAVLATSVGKRHVEAERAKVTERSLKEKAQWIAVADKMKDLSLTIPEKVSEGEKLYGSVQAGDISAKLKEIGFDVDKKAILLAEPIKQLGMYTIRIQLHRDVEAKVRLWIISDESK